MATIRALADVAHAAGLAVAQKNAAELAARKIEMGTDFAVAEECNAYEECDAYQGAYGNHVLVIEYQQESFDRGCSAPGALDRAARPGGLPPGLAALSV